MDGIEVITVGHGTATTDELASVLHGADVRLVVDVRTAPGSRRHPHMSRSALEQSLPERQIGYRWDKRLGGWRKTPSDSPDIALRERALAGYAAHMRSAEFAAAIDALLRDAGTTRIAIMCAESLWWRCHRRLVADHLVLVRDVAVRHLMPDGRLQAHPASELARVRADELVYDAGQPPDGAGAGCPSA